MRKLHNGIILPRYFNSDADLERLKCSHCVKARANNPLDVPDIDFFNEHLKYLSLLRERCDFPFIITSGFRCLKHEIEVAKPPGARHAHTRAASDIYCVDSHRRGEIYRHAIALGFLGIYHKENFVHVDRLPERGKLMIW